ncbi:MAG TPA: hypothetical protein VGU43_07430 [Thermoplasmata archaeon]|nr:hypothetical protein [Thermoplasmata archaeon]
MGASPDTVNNVESLIDSIRRELIESLDLPPHVRINLHPRDRVFEEHLEELLAFSHLRAAKSEVVATQALTSAVAAQTRISMEQAAAGKRLVSVTWALVLVGAGTLAVGAASLAWFVFH